MTTTEHPFTVSLPGRAPLDGVLRVDGDRWTLDVSEWSASPTFPPAALSSGPGAADAALRLLAGAVAPPAAGAPGGGPSAGLVHPGALAPGPAGMPAPADPDPDAEAHYRAPSDAEIAAVLAGFDAAALRERLPGKWVISFSLYGANPLYTTGAIENAIRAARLFPEFTCRFYVGRSVPRHVVVALGDLPNVELVDMSAYPEDNGAMFWRFLAPADPEVDVVLVRDADSRLNVRDRAAVNEWLASGASFHIVRDHPLHNMPIVGGAWGCLAGALRFMPTLLAAAGPFPDVKGIDQEFLARYVYPVALVSCVIHDEVTAMEPADHPARHPFPLPMVAAWDHVVRPIGGS